MCRFSTLVPAKDGGGCAFLDLLVEGRRTGIGVVPATVVRSFDDVDGILMGKEADGKTGRDGIQRVIGCHLWWE